jgi:hypothetical protein
VFTRRLRSFAAAATLSLTLAFAYQTLAAESFGPPAAKPAAAARAGAVIHGRGVARFAGYELNISFTPEGRLLCFGVSPQKAGGETPEG